MSGLKITVRISTKYQKTARGVNLNMLASIIIEIKQVLMSRCPDTSFLALTKLLDSDSTSLPADVLWDSFVTHSFLPHKSCLKSPPKEK